MKGVFVTGTNTGIGKTTYAAKLCRLHPEATYFKPVQTGWPEDDDFRAAGAARGIRGLCFRDPVSPHLAAAREGTEITLERILAPLEGFTGTLVAEGAGGLLVPLSPTLLQTDLIAALDLPVVVVTPDVLGAINHTLLTLEALRRRNLRLAGVHVWGDDPHLGNREAIERHGGVPIVEDCL